MAAVTGASREGNTTQRIQLAFTPSVFALELMGGADSLRFRSVLAGHGLVDVTPGLENPTTHELEIPTERFKSATPRPVWSGYWHALRADWRVQTATWVCLSGHHGRRNATTPVTTAAEINAVKETGFFNHPFHENEWETGTSHPESIFVYSSRTRGPNDEAPPEWGAPFFENRRCAGVFLSGCNTLAYPATRRWVRKTFPRAIVFGFINKTRFGAHNAAPLVGMAKAQAGKRIEGFLEKEKEFWLNPGKWIVVQANKAKREPKEQVELMVKEMNRIYHRASSRGADLAMIYGDDMFFMSGGSVTQERYDFTW